MIEKPKIISANEIPSGAKVVDAYTCALKELYWLTNLNVKKDSPIPEDLMEDFSRRYGADDAWVYYPWNNTAVHILAEDLYFRLRTARNQNLITFSEQQRYRQCKVGLAGLSVGSEILKALVVSGGPKKLRIADPDVIEVTNLNRINAKLTDVGSNKTDVAAREVWELDPFAEIDVWDMGLNEDSLTEFVNKHPKLDILIDEMDNISLKISSRIVCRKEKVPVLMATDNGDSVLLDVERFDLEPERSLFHGLAGNLDLVELAKLDRKGWIKLSTEIIGPDYMTPNLQRSLLSIGNSLAGVPQLGTTAMMAGAAVSFAVRQIANGYELPSGRYVISLEEVLIPGHKSLESLKSREEGTKTFKEKLKGG